MANKYDRSLAVLLNNGTEQILPVSKAQLIELANADKTKFSGYNVNNALSVQDALTYLLNKGNSDLEDAKTYTGTSINGLNSTITAGNGYVFGSITETAGKLTSYSQIWLDASVVSYNGDSNVKSAIETLQTDLANLSGNGQGSVQSQITAAIEGLDANAMGETGKAIVSVSEADGIVTATAGNIDAQYVDVDNTNLQWDLDDTAGADSDITVQSAIEHLQSEISAAVGDAARYTITEVTGNGIPETVAHRYQLSQSINGAAATKAGEYIDIPKDSSLKEVYLGLSTDTVDANTGVVTKGAAQGADVQSLNFVYHLEDGTYSLVPIDVSKFLTENEFGNGLDVNNGVVSVKVTDADNFLSVNSTDGVKLSGVQTAINTAEQNAKTYASGLIADLDSSVGAEYQSTDVAYVLTGVTQADGELTSYYGVALDDTHVKTTFAAQNDPIAALVKQGDTNPTNVKQALDLIASSLSALTGTAPIDTINGDSDNTYVNISAEKSGSRVTLTIDDSALGNVSKLQYEQVASWNGEVANIFNPVV